MEQVLGTILIIFLAFWLLGIAGKFLLRYWLLKKQRQMEEQIKNGGSGYQTFGGGNFRGFYSTTGGANQQQKPKQPEGEVTIEIKEPQKEVSKEIGEYVEFEEVEENK